MKKNFYRARSRKIKKRYFQQKNLHFIKNLAYLKYNLFSFFIQKENIKLNRKVLAELITTEVGSMFSLSMWNIYLYTA
uniref:Ribosomal protein L20 n=1 Tax=Melanthalia intermedia TaxID=172989 RepID=A0A345UBN1_9FLOR|nr:ribosomal protein L20 [Melanthalia intermedia]AXI97867.1 ribosomal protein L20 [Melanthalia intermedia]